MKCVRAIEIEKMKKMIRGGGRKGRAPKATYATYKLASIFNQASIFFNVQLKV